MNLFLPEFYIFTKRKCMNYTNRYQHLSSPPWSSYNTRSIFSSIQLVLNSVFSEPRLKSPVCPTLSWGKKRWIHDFPWEFTWSEMQAGFELGLLSLFPYDDNYYTTGSCHWYVFSLPLHQGRMWHKVNFLIEV